MNTADPYASEQALSAQPVGYWAGAVHKAVVGRLRDAMAGIDVTQPQWWVLTRVDAGDFTRDQVAAQLAEVADGPSEVPRAIAQLEHRDWIAADDNGRLRMTDAGRAAQGRIRVLVGDLRTRIHEGISDEEYVVALKVMRRMIANASAT
ncbi:MarR family winged helix-turn-helix transcriptional regulator [Actinoplanes sp. G11-F43]|uniref:MarR family winged helix-turn-helix transcriptional regulator n=1 Tax=Actinoplanes sp. G11-F43 TaxID=3424130 RepID=UPI003D330649